MKSFSLNFEAIGTKWVIDIKDSPLDQNLLENKIFEEIHEFSKIFSRFDPDSEVSKAAISVTQIKIPEGYFEIISIYEKLYKITEGKFTPLIGNLLEDAGYDKNYSLTPKKLRPVPKWDDVIKIKKNILEIMNPAVLDFGAGGKGFLTDLVGNILKKNGIKEYCIDAGGDILYKSDEKIKIGLENPDDFKQVIGVCEIKNQSLCGSAGNRRKWGEFHHILNPETLKSVENIKAVWVTAKTGLIADSLSTALFFTNPETLKKHFDFEYLLILNDLSFEKSDEFPGEVFIS